MRSGRVPTPEGEALIRIKEGNALGWGHGPEKGPSELEPGDTPCPTPKPRPISGPAPAISTGPTAAPSGVPSVPGSGAPGRYGGGICGYPRSPPRKSSSRRLAAPRAWREVVFCGLGEPTLRREIVPETADRLKIVGLRTRLNTDRRAGELAPGPGCHPGPQGPDRCPNHSAKCPERDRIQPALPTPGERGLSRPSGLRIPGPISGPLDHPDRHPGPAGGGYPRLPGHCPPSGGLLPHPGARPDRISHTFPTSPGPRKGGSSGTGRDPDRLSQGPCRAGRPTAARLPPPNEQGNQAGLPFALPGWLRSTD